MKTEEELRKESQKKEDFKDKIKTIIIVTLVLTVVIVGGYFFFKKISITGEIRLIENIKTIYIGEKKQIKAEVTNFENSVISYASSDERIIKIENGVMEGISIGKATVIISCDRKVIEPLKIEVEVINGGAMISSASFPYGELVIGIDKIFDLNEKIIINPSNGTAKSKIFISSNPEVATISELGILTTIKEGMTNISTNINNRFNSTITVYVISDDNPGEIIKNPNKIVFKEESLKLKVRDSVDLEYSFVPSDADPKYVTFESSNEDVVTVSKDGRIKAVASGGAEIIGKTVDNKEYKIKVDVYEKDIG